MNALTVSHFIFRFTSRRGFQRFLSPGPNPIRLIRLIRLFFKKTFGISFPWNFSGSSLLDFSPASTRRPTRHGEPCMARASS
jgi:hypothetical protein